MCVCLLIEMHLVYKAENGTTTAEDYNDDAQGELQPYVMQTHTHTHTHKCAYSSLVCVSAALSASALAEDGNTKPMMTNLKTTHRAATRQRGSNKNNNKSDNNNNNTPTIP